MDSAASTAKDLGRALLGSFARVKQARQHTHTHSLSLSIDLSLSLSRLFFSISYCLSLSPPPLPLSLGSLRRLYPVGRGEAGDGGQDGV